MPKHSLRGRSKKHVQVRVPGNHTRTRYKKDRIERAHCVRCGQTLAGVAALPPMETKQLSPTGRRIERSFGGQLCSDCLRQLMKQAVRTMQT